MYKFYITFKYVYVTSYSEHILAVYTTESERVASFGQKGADDFNCPRGITMVLCMCVIFITIEFKCFDSILHSILLKNQFFPL